MQNIAGANLHDNHTEPLLPTTPQHGLGFAARGQECWGEIPPAHWAAVKYSTQHVQEMAKLRKHPNYAYLTSLIQLL